MKFRHSEYIEEALAMAEFDKLEDDT